MPSHWNWCVCRYQPIRKKSVAAGLLTEPVLVDRRSPHSFHNSVCRPCFLAIGETSAQSKYGVLGPQIKLTELTLKVLSHTIHQKFDRLC